MTRSPCWTATAPTRLGNRKLGELSDMVSQFEVEDDYTQINYQGKPVRVTGLMYGDIIKWFNNRAEGLPAYLIIDMTTQEVTVQRLDEGIKYTTAEHFNRNLIRHLRFQYPPICSASPISRSMTTGRALLGLRPGWTRPSAFSAAWM